MENARQQIVDSINANTNILVTVSSSPSVDELSAALGLTILLNNLEKRATAVFSGAIPAAINFLEPAKTFENTADSLRDFIIALDKEKADHLRYKVEGDVVKIFITPYKTTLTQKDLDFSQGDYNVELVIGVGVKDQDHLDKALAAHGKILHDATVVTVSAGAAASTLGSIDWNDPAASSLGEMMVSLVDGLKTDKPLLDEQISTAFLTGIVSATDRFSNDRTSSRVMTMAAQLMAAGANQQLIAAKLSEAHDIGPGAVAGKEAASSVEAVAPQSVQNSNELSIDRQSKKSRRSKKNNDPTAQAALAPATSGETASDAIEQPKDDEVPGEKELEAQIAAASAPPIAESMQDIEKALQDATSQLTESSQEEAKTAQEQPVAEVSAEPAPAQDQQSLPANEPELPPLPDLSALQQPADSPFSPAPPQPGIVSEPVATAPADAPVPPQVSDTPVVAPEPQQPVSDSLPELPSLPPLPDFSAEPAPNADAASMIINDHGTFSDQPPSTTQPINSFNAPQGASDATVNPFAEPITTVPEPAPVVPPTLAQDTTFEPVPAPTVPVDTPVFGTPEGAALLGAMPTSEPAQAAPEIPALPPLPPLPPLPTDGSLPPLPPPPPLPTLSQPTSGLSGAVSGDVFGDAATIPAPVAEQQPAPAPEPGQYRIPGQG